MPSVSPSVSDGYLRAVVGAFIGGSLLGIAVGALMFLIPCENQGFECLGVAVLALLGAAIGSAIGATVGCFIALRRNHPAAGRTAWYLLGLVAASTVLMGMAAGSVSLGGETADSLFATVLYLASPLVARWLALKSVPPVEI